MGSNGSRNGKNVLRGAGVVVEYNARHFGKDRGQGLIHRGDVDCDVNPQDCGKREHLVRFSVFEVQYLGEIPEPGDEVQFTALPAIHRGELPVVDNMKLVFGKSRDHGKMIPEHVQYGR